VVPVDLSGLIFVALALVWAVVLIPKALREHDDAARTRSVEASSDSARVLTRSGRAPQPLTVPVSKADRGPHLEVPQSAAARQRRLAAHAARRRRRVLGLLVLAGVATGGASIGGLLAPWAAAVPGGVVLGFLMLARVIVRREQAAWGETRRRMPAERSGDQAPGVAVDRADESAGAAPDLHVVARNDQGVAVVSDSEDTSAFDAASLAGVVGAPTSTLWDPLPLTLPTYVSKPRATRSVRTIDLQAPGVSSSGHDAVDSALVAEAGSGTEDQDPPAQQAVGS
jgi:hypothetical protein